MTHRDVVALADRHHSQLRFHRIRSCVTEQDWERLRRPILRRAGYRCEACGDGEDRATSRLLEVHERWHYNNDTGVQTLRRLICLCSPCHLVTHLGYANVTGRTEEALTHLRRVNGWDDGKTYAHVYASEQQWLDRSARTWTLDLSMLTCAGIAVRRPQSAADRPAAAERALQAANASAPPRQHRPPPAMPEPVPSPATRPVSGGSRAGLWSRLTGRGRT